MSMDDHITLMIMTREFLEQNQFIDTNPERIIRSVMKKTPILGFCSLRIEDMNKKNIPINSTNPCCTCMNSVRIGNKCTCKLFNTDCINKFENELRAEMDIT